MVATGICNELKFHDENMVLNKYYHFPGKFNLVKYGTVVSHLYQPIRSKLKS